MKLREDEDSLDETDLYYSFWSMIADFNEIKIALDWSSSEILDILDYTNSIILSSLHVALAPVIQRSEGWKDRAMIVQFSKLRSGIILHLDVSPCHAVIICHMSPLCDTRVGPCHLHGAVKYWLCPVLQPPIFACIVRIYKHIHRKKTVEFTPPLPHPNNNEADRITTCFVASVPLRWFPEDDPSLVTLLHCHQDYRHVPCSLRHREPLCH